MKRGSLRIDRKNFTMIALNEYVLKTISSDANCRNICKDWNWWDQFFYVSLCFVFLAGQGVANDNRRANMCTRINSPFNNRTTVWKRCHFEEKGQLSGSKQIVSSWKEKKNIFSRWKHSNEACDSTNWQTNTDVIKTWICNTVVTVKITVPIRHLKIWLKMWLAFFRNTTPAVKKCFFFKKKSNGENYLSRGLILKNLIGQSYLFGLHHFVA